MRRAGRVVAAVVAWGSACGAEPPPWRAGEALGLPSWLRVGLEHRERVERLSSDFRAGSPGGVTALSLRTRLVAEARGAAVTAGVELVDARAFATRDSALNTTIVDPLDVLQAYAGLRGASVLIDGDAASVKAGRFTIDLGSRRLVARNDYRNTINGFSGVDATWRSPAGHALRALVVTPVTRLPSSPAALADARLARDRESSGAVLWALALSSASIAGRARVESYVIGLGERDTPAVPSADRRLVTPGARVVVAPSPGALDGELEVMGQLGTSRASSAASDHRELRHRAASVHAEVGLLAAAPLRPRLALLLDAASGDRDPSDGVNGRFDPLFAARRFDFGPTGLWGVLARSDLASPGARLQLEPLPTVGVVATYRAAWLASARDAWTAAGVRDRAGDSGAFIGHVVDARARWSPVPGNVAIEIGAAALARGRFAREAEGGRDGTPLYAYAQVVGTI